MTKRKNPEDKIRDADATKRMLLEAVGEISKEYGFGAVTAGKIASWTGKSTSTVQKSFGNMMGLKKAYIARKDYWAAFFEYFVPADHSEEQLKSLFVELMQENLKSFWGDEEVQKLIHWQMGAKCKLMRSASEARELAGNELLKLTDSFFAGTETSFRMVVAILLYGTYGMVMHAKNNKSTVCGVDINNDRERQVMHKTIEQVIGWAWGVGAQ